MFSFDYYNANFAGPSQLMKYKEKSLREFLEGQNICNFNQNIFLKGRVCKEIRQLNFNNSTKELVGVKCACNYTTFNYKEFLKDLSITDDIKENKEQLISDFNAFSCLCMDCTDNSRPYINKKRTEKGIHFINKRKDLKGIIRYFSVL